MNEILKAYYAHFIKLGAIHDLAIRLAILATVILLRGGRIESINSVFRSLEKQRDLASRYAAGEPGIGPVARRSWHTVGRAADVNFSPGWQHFAGELWRRMGGRWGGDFSNPEPWHFDLPGPTAPPAAW